MSTRVLHRPRARKPARDDAKQTAAPRLVLLGTVTLVSPAGALPLSRKDAALLAVLAIDGPTASAQLAALLWPDVDEKAAANSLRQRIHRLRRAAGHTLVDTSVTLSLHAEVTTDLSAALDAIAQDAAASAGDLLGGLSFDDLPEFDEWAQAARDRWHAQRADAIAAAASRCEQAGELARALAYAQRLLAEQPQAEHAHRRLMRLHYLRGDRAAALAAFERCRDWLKRELGASPGRETLELAQLIERSGALVSAATSPVAKPVAMLRPPRLVGREEEWAQLGRAWEGGRVVLISGEPGIGKTRLVGDFAAERPGAIVVGARPGDARVPYALLARWVRSCVREFGAPADAWVTGELAHIAPELGVPVEAKVDPLRMRQAMLAGLAAWSTGGLTAVAIDDLQFSDEATLELLPALADESRATLRWLFAVRGNDVPASISAWLDSSDPESLLRIELGPLTLTVTEALLRSLALAQLDVTAWATPLYRHTGGNPMFMLETLLAIAAGAPLPAGPSRLPVPANIGMLIEKRLSQLSPGALKLARVAALAGSDFSADLAADVLAVHALDLAEPWRELE
ncbi:MAG: AAA family ATPase, partial [Gemmatimonadota bacterium]